MRRPPGIGGPPFRPRPQVLLSRVEESRNTRQRGGSAGEAVLVHCGWRTAASRHGPAGGPRRCATLLVGGTHDPGRTREDRERVPARDRHSRRQPRRRLYGAVRASLDARRTRRSPRAGPEGRRHACGRPRLPRRPGEGKATLSRSRQRSDRCSTLARRRRSPPLSRISGTFSSAGPTWTRYCRPAGRSRGRPGTGTACGLSPWRWPTWPVAAARRSGMRST